MIVPVILSGGAGTRLWPVSREGHPKPFMKLADGESLLLKTYLRALGMMQAMGNTDGELLTVTNRNYYFMTRDEFPNTNVTNVFLLEPESRNTAPAVTFAAHYLVDKYGPETLMLVLAADQIIEDQPSFTTAVSDAASLAEDGYLVTFGITPSRPETGFGYIEAGMPLLQGYKAVHFFEKPPIEKAQTYLTNGNFYWNSGIFCFQAGRLLEEITLHSPDVASAVQACWQVTKSKPTDQTNVLYIPDQNFAVVPDISIDYAVMERSNHVAILPSNFGWSDVGTWGAMRDRVPPDVVHNRSVGEVVFVDTRNTFVQSEGRLVAALGVDNLVIVDTPDALLVAHLDKVQDVKKVVAQLKTNDHGTCKLHRTVARPWGDYTILGEGECFKIKRIKVKPGAVLSLQMHHHRSEHWIVVSGTAQVINGEKEMIVRTNESTYIPAGHKHRLTNPGIIDLVIIEVQSGKYLGEDDIIRFDDIYGRHQLI